MRRKKVEAEFTQNAKIPVCGAGLMREAAGVPLSCA